MPNVRWLLALFVAAGLTAAISAPSEAADPNGFCEQQEAACYMICTSSFPTTSEAGIINRWGCQQSCGISYQTCLQNFEGLYPPPPQGNACPGANSLAIGMDLSGCSCQQVADTYWIYPGWPYAYAPDFVQSYWTSHHCSAIPQITCQEMSNAFSIFPYWTWGTAAWGNDITGPQTVFMAKQCNTVPTNFSCQAAADKYSIIPNVTWGTAPTYIVQLYAAFGCNLGPSTESLSGRAHF